MKKDENIKIKAISDKDGMQMSSKEKDARKNHHKSRSCLSFLLVIIISFVIGGLGGLVFDNVLFDYLSRVPFLSDGELLQVKESQVVIQREEKVTTTSEEAVTSLVKDANAAMVTIVKKQTTTSDKVQIASQAEGYGLVLTADGLIVSSDRVFTSQPDQYEIVASDGSVYPVKKIIKDPLGEMTFVKVKADNLTVAELGNSDDLQVGQKVYSVLSNPLGKVEVKSIMLEDVVYNPTFPLDSDQVEYYLKGDVTNFAHGSVLFTIDGKVAGLVVPGQQDDRLIYPASDIELALSEVVAKSKITRPVIGVRYVKLNNKLARMNGLSVNEGLLIYNPAGQAAVTAGSPAAIAGLQAGDIIINVKGEKVNGNYSLPREAKQWNKGEEVEVKYLRAGQEETAKMVIKEIKEAK
ncbi:MAG: serine protease [Parcubacteria group bacterium]|nr:serine protease [Parcubacteria group bacterium]